MEPDVFTIIEQAWTMCFEVLTLSAFVTNNRSIYVYEKVGLCGRERF